MDEGRRGTNRDGKRQRFGEGGGDDACFSRSHGKRSKENFNRRDSSPLFPASQCRSTNRQPASTVPSPRLASTSVLQSFNDLSYLVESNGNAADECLAHRTSRAASRVHPSTGLGKAAEWCVHVFSWASRLPLMTHRKVCSLFRPSSPSLLITAVVSVSAATAASLQQETTASPDLLCYKQCIAEAVETPAACLAACPQFCPNNCTRSARGGRLPSQPLVPAISVILFSFTLLALAIVCLSLVFVIFVCAVSHQQSQHLQWTLQLRPRAMRMRQILFYWRQLLDRDRG